MKIDSVKAVPLNLKFVPEHKTSFTTYKQINNILVVIKSDDGITGFGEGALIPQHLGESQGNALSLVNDQLAPKFIGIDPFDKKYIYKMMRSIVAEAKGTKSAIDLALYDLVAKKLSLPFYKLMGGIVQEKFPTASGIGYSSPDRMIEEIDEKIKMGYRSFEVKMSGHASSDLEVCSTIATSIPQNIVLMLDPNEGWNVTETIEIGKRLSKYGNRFYFEQPLPKENVSGMAQVRRIINIPIIAHEAITSVKYAYEIIRAEAADVINITLARLGSIDACLDVMALCKGAGIDFRIDSPIQSKVGDSALAHMGVSSEHILAACDTHLYIEGGPTIVGGIELEDGWVSVADKPGLGIDIVSWEGGENIFDK